MATVRDMIRKKGGEVYAIPPEATVYEALKAMAGLSCVATGARRGSLRRQ